MEQRLRTSARIITWDSYLYLSQQTLVIYESFLRTTTVISTIFRHYCYDEHYCCYEHYYYDGHYCMLLLVKMLCLCLNTFCSSIIV